jgi:DNA repair protein RadC
MSTRISLQAFPHSPGLSEIKVSYRNRVKSSARRPVQFPQDAIEYLRDIWDADTVELTEQFVIVCLNGSHQAFGWVKISSGGFSSSLIDPRVVFAIALQTACSALVLAHNHPSGSTEPSREDLDITQRLKQAGELLGIKVLDHIILTRDTAVSFLERGLM